MRRRWRWNYRLMRCLDELPDGLADDPGDGSIPSQCNLSERPIILLFQAHGKPGRLSRTLVHATPHDSVGELTRALIRLQLSDALFTAKMRAHQSRLVRLHNARSV
jgi:hypothetical protein